MKLKKNIISKNIKNSVSILLTDHFSINEELLLKSLKYIKNSNLKKIYLIGDKIKFKKIYKKTKLIKNKIIFININLVKKNYFLYLKKITKTSIDLFKNNKINFMINMPLNKKKFFNGKFDGFTEFFSNEFNNRKLPSMLLYNPKFSVSPITTHLQIKNIDRNITKRKIKNAILNINYFYKTIIKKKIQIVVLGLNPHASKDMNNNNKDKKIILPIIKELRNVKKIDVIGPVPADTAFGEIKNKVFVGMYHDQVLVPFKLINRFEGINITIGNKLIRISPDHGTGEKIIKNIKKIDNTSFIHCIKFCENNVSV